MVGCKSNTGRGTNHALSEVRGRPPLTGQKDKSCRRGLRTFRPAMRLRPQSRVLHHVLNQLCRPLLYPFLASRDDGSQRYEKRGTHGKRLRASRTQSAAAHSRKKDRDASASAGAASAIASRLRLWKTSTRTPSIRTLLVKHRRTRRSRRHRRNAPTQLGAQSLQESRQEMSTSSGHQSQCSTNLPAE